MNNWNILVENTTDGFTLATVLEVPDCQVRDETKEGAVEKVQQLLQKRLAQAEIVRITVPVKPTTSENLMRFAGIFQNDPDFEEIMQEIRAEREQDSDL